MTKTKQTPLMRQYNQIKAKHPDTILLFRLGDFFETFGDDAVTTARVCGITLTKRNNGAAGEVALAGFPHHQLDSYLPKIVRAGFRVAVCEQLEDPKLARGIVKRDVVEVVTPGVALYDRMLDSRRNTYVCAVVLPHQTDTTRLCGIAFADVSTAEFNCCEVLERDIVSTLEGIAPAEVLHLKSQTQDVTSVLSSLHEQPALTRREDWIFQEDFGREILLRHFRTQGLKGFGVDQFPRAISAAGAVLHYIGETQQGRMAHFSSLRLYDTGDVMMLDAATRRNLEITSSSQGTEASLVHVLDETCTAMGGRMLRSWLGRPLRNRERIDRRLDVVQECISHPALLSELRRLLGGVADMERLVSKVCTQRATTRDLVSLRQSLDITPTLKLAAQKEPCGQLQHLLAGIDTLHPLSLMLDAALIDEPSLQFGSGSIFRTGYHAELDAIREAMFSGKNLIRDYQERLRTETSIASLKVSFNNVFGYYIEVSNTHSAKVPTSFHRKQTLANAERYTTSELKEIESRILSAEERITSLEQQLFAELRQTVAGYSVPIQNNAQIIAQVDCLQSFATIAVRSEYCRPVMRDDGAVVIDEGRHPVVEKLLPLGTTYVPNNTRLDTDVEQIHIITGPNMAGKSCYLRQVGLIVLLAHVGSYVPARRAEVSMCDRIFTRVGAHDNISAGESTFLIEMQEAANILHNASKNSLILLDEVGRGTATFDGISIAWAIVEYLHERCGAKTLFATHYHELSDLAELFSGIHNYNVEVQEVASTVIFTRNVVRGSTDHSFGIHVAQMAGLPHEVTARAREVLTTLELNNAQLLERSGAAPTGRGQRVVRHSIEAQGSNANGESQISMFELRDDSLREKIAAIDVDNLSPLQALQKLSELVQDAGKRTS